MTSTSRKIVDHTRAVCAWLVLCLLTVSAPASARQHTFSEPHLIRMASTPFGDGSNGSARRSWSCAASIAPNPRHPGLFHSRAGAIGCCLLDRAISAAHLASSLSALAVMGKAEGSAAVDGAAHGADEGAVAALAKEAAQVVAQRLRNAWPRDCCSLADSASRSPRMR